MTVEQLAQAAHADHEIGEEIAPGVVIERRTILRIGVSIAALAAMGTAGMLAGCAGDKPVQAEPIRTTSWPSCEELLRKIRPQAQSLITSSVPDEETYLAAVAALLARAERPQSLLSSPLPDQQFSMDTLAYLPPIAFFEIKMAPGAIINLHDHRHYNGVLLGIEGAARVRNFEIVEPDGRRLDIAAGDVPPVGHDFLIRRTQERTLGVNQLSTLTRDRDNIHHVEAGPNGCRMLDLFTHFRPEARSYSLAWDGKAFDESKGLYKVAWQHG